jgi:hypothetical protein
VLRVVQSITLLCCLVDFDSRHALLCPLQVLELQNALGRLEQDLAARDKQLAAMQTALAGQGPAPLAPSAVAASGALPSGLGPGAAPSLGMGTASTPEARRMGTPGYAKGLYESASNFMGSAPGGWPGVRAGSSKRTVLHARLLQIVRMEAHSLQQGGPAGHLHVA